MFIRDRVMLGSRGKWLLFSLVLSLATHVSAQDYQTYIRSYQDIAIAEMLRTGIPASIKLAQAIHESNCGRSELAVKANNHFGIKCGNDWRGKAHHKEDDDYINGKLVKSCFRSFSTVEESFMAHSDFLTDPSKTARYGHLFKLDVTDYKGWARGLSKSGYATDPHYANKIISLIERFELYQFDGEYGRPLASGKPVPSTEVSKTVYEPIRYNNDVRYIVARDSDTPWDIARRQDVHVKQLINYNDDIVSADQELVKGAKVYLQPKRNSFRGQQKFHTVKEGDDMLSISQQYGIKLSALLKRNSLEVGEIPLPKQQVALKGKLKTKLKTTRTAIPAAKPIPQVESPVNETLFDEEDEQIRGEVNTNTRPTMEQPQVRNSNNTADIVIHTPSGTQTTPPVTTATEKPEAQSHTVQKGDTLYSIARAYGLSVTDLKKMNTLSADTIKVGQILVVK